MKKRIAIISEPATGASVHDAFIRLSWNARLFVYRPKSPENIFVRAYAKMKSRLRKVDITTQYNLALRSEIIPSIKLLRPKFVLLIKGYQISEENYHSLKKLNIPIALWTIDSLQRFPAQASVQDITIHNFFMDGGDVVNDKSTWMPLGYDDMIYKPSRNNKNIDILFIGFIKMPYYKKRLNYLIELSNSRLINRYKCVFAGTTGDRYFDNMLSRRIGMTVTGRKSPQHYADLISNSKVCINIHQDDGDQPVNPSFFAIPGSGTCQIAEDRKYFNNWLEPSKEYIVFKRDEFIDEVENILDNNELQKAIVNEGLKRVKSDHKFIHRAINIVNILERS